MSNYATDIETMQNDDLVAQMPEPEYKYGNAKKPEARAKVELEAKERQLRDMALSPTTGRIASFAMVDEGLNGTCVRSNGLTDSDEIKIIHEIWSAWSDAETLITYAGNVFDIPFVFMRSLILGVPIPRTIPQLASMVNRNRPHGHIDMSVVFETGWRQFPKLKFLAKVLFGMDPIDFDVSRNRECVLSRDSTLDGYNIRDGVITMMLFDRFEEIVYRPAPTRVQ